MPAKLQNTMPQDWHAEVKPGARAHVMDDKGNIKKVEVYGYADIQDQKIVINPKRGDVVNTIIHEKLHANYPNMSHEKVYENAQKIESKMTLPDMAMELLDVHQRSVNPPPTKTELTHTEVSNIISRKIN